MKPGLVTRLHGDGWIRTDDLLVPNQTASPRLSSSRSSCLPQKAGQGSARPRCGVSSGKRRAGQELSWMCRRTGCGTPTVRMPSTAAPRFIWCKLRSATAPSRPRASTCTRASRAATAATFSALTPTWPNAEKISVTSELPHERNQCVRPLSVITIFVREFSRHEVLFHPYPVHEGETNDGKDDPP
jgi:hypothetical protein